VRALTLAPQDSFHKYYLPPRMDNAPPIHVQDNGKYSLPTTPVPPSVGSEAKMLKKIAGLKFMDHDITDEQKISKLVREKYLRTRSIPGRGEILLETQEWVKGLEKACILNLLEIPHFQRILEIIACVKVFLKYVHGGTLWLDPPVSIDTALIAHIIGLPKFCEDLTILFNKIGERSLSDSMKENL
jgi:hypothetical protein